MSDQTENAEKKVRGILRKRDTPAEVPNISTKARITAYRAKPKVDSNPPTARSTDGSLFSRRTKMNQCKPGTAPATAPGTPRNQQQVAMSACPSTTTLDSRITATSHSSFSHKPGFLPNYIRNKTVSKNLVAAQVQSNKKQCIQIRKELTDMQNTALEYFKRYRESLAKLNKINGKDEPPVIEELKIIDIKEVFDEAPSDSNKIPADPPKKVAVLPEVKLAPKLSFSKLKQITDDKVLAHISSQVHTIQVHSFKLLQEFSDRLALINNQMKIAESSEGGDTNLFPAKIQSLFEEIETKILEEEEAQSTRIISFMTNLKQVMINEQGTPVMMKDGMYAEFENYRRANEHKMIELEMKIKDLELQKIHEEYKNVELMKAISHEKNTVNELNAVISENQSKHQDRDKEFEKLLLKTKQIELANKRMEKQLEDRVLEVNAKDKTIAELQAAIKSMQDKVLKSSNQIQKLEGKLNRTEEEHTQLMDRMKSRYDEEIKTCNMLRCQLNEIDTGMADDCKMLREDNARLRNSENILLKEIDSLKISLNEILQKRSINERVKSEDNVYRREIERRDEEANRIKIMMNEMKDELIKRELLVVQKTREVCELEHLVTQLEKRDKINEFQEEILRLQDLNKQKSREIEQYQIDLNKAETALRLQEESLYMQKRLLKIRSELIQSLQENEDSTRTQISDLHSEVERRTYAVKQLNKEVSAKKEELENLFSTLGAKNLEVKRQDHNIKLLEETHERNQKIRVKLEGKIARLENENAELKRFVKYRT